jgi:hypothetical protein
MKPPIRFLRKAVRKPPWSLAAVGIDRSAVSEEDKEGTKQLTEKI